jgi:hypothetical protein
MRLKWLGEAGRKYWLLLVVGVNEHADREGVMWKSNAVATKKSVNFINKLPLFTPHFELEEKFLGSIYWRIVVQREHPTKRKNI